MKWASIGGMSDVVRLEPVTVKNVREVCALRVAPAQEQFVTANAVSLAEAQFYEHAWFRAAYAGDDELVGFVMLWDSISDPGYMLWRLMIDERHQGRGYGRQVVLAVIDYVRTRPGATSLAVGARAGEGGPASFYESLGFVATGEVIEGNEYIYRLSL